MGVRGEKNIAVHDVSSLASSALFAEREERERGRERERENKKEKRV